MPRNTRQLRRRAARLARKTSIRQAEALTHVEHFRAPAGKVACSIHFEGLEPATVVIDAARLADIVAGMDQLLCGRTYQQVVDVFSTYFRACKGGDKRAENGLLLVFGLALRHPTAGERMRDAISAALRKDGRAHLTFCAGADRGIAIALGERFHDLGEAVEASKEVSGVVIVEREHEAETFQ